MAQFNVRIVEAIAIRVSPYCGKQQLVPIILNTMPISEYDVT